MERNPLLRLQARKQIPDDGDRALLAELSKRAHVDAVLGQLERMIARQGPAKRLGRSDSKQISRALSRSMRGGASRQARVTVLLHGRWW